MTAKKEIQEKLLKPVSGISVLIVTIILFLAATGACIYSGFLLENADYALGVPIFVVSIIYISLIGPITCAGFKVVSPNEALVLLLFGKYYGTIASDGFFWVNPFTNAFNPAAKGLWLNIIAAASKNENKGGDGSNSSLNKKLSLKANTLNNEKQKINDLEGNPIEIGVNIVWRIINTAKAVFNVDNYINFISSQADLAIRQVARLYPYDLSENGDEKSLRGSSSEISNELKKELQGRLEIAGIEVMEASISHLAYAQEIAAAMLQRQQASAVIAARQKIVEGAVGMVEMALDRLNEHKTVEFDEERKAAMVSNLLVVLCGNKDAQPIVNSGSIY